MEGSSRMAGGAVSQRPHDVGDAWDVGAPELSIVVPVYNERATLEKIGRAHV